MRIRACPLQRPTATPWRRATRPATPHPIRRALASRPRSQPTRRRPRRPPASRPRRPVPPRSEEHTSELQSPCNLVCRLLLEKKKHNPAASIPSFYSLPTCFRSYHSLFRELLRARTGLRRRRRSPPADPRLPALTDRFWSERL